MENKRVQARGRMPCSTCTARIEISVPVYGLYRACYGFTRVCKGLRGFSKILPFAGFMGLYILQDKHAASDGSLLAFGFRWLSGLGRVEGLRKD